jgi:hypothetical protein
MVKKQLVKEKKGQIEEVSHSNEWNKKLEISIQYQEGTFRISLTQSRS